MQKKLALLIVLALPFMLFSCEKPERETKQVTLNVNIKTNEVYSLDVSQYGDKDDNATISQQAIHFTSSQLSKNASDRYIFEFSTTTKVQDTEDVVINLTEDHNRCRRDNNPEAVIHIHFVIQ